MFNADENKEKARILIINWLMAMRRGDLFLSKEDFNTLLDLAVDQEKGKVPAIKFLRSLLLDEPAPWSPQEYGNNQFEYFVKNQNSKPAQTLYPLVSLKKARDIVDWLAAQKDWFS